ncbi:MAG: cohesin domain-containing protein [candidate division KSB1 bacterium]|nr:cohesin domain-containing protein [candidate division KSB1 bacterium]
MKARTSLLGLVAIAVACTMSQAAVVTDNFNRSTLGPNWAAHAAYQIVNNTLANTSTTPGWNYLAVFTAVTNPTEVSFKWAPNATVEGINAGGIAIFLNAPSSTATGYCVIRRGGYILLCPVVNGEVVRDQPIDSKPVALPVYQPGDVIKVVASTDAAGHHFDFYINGLFDTRVNDTQKRYGTSGVLYAGVSLFGNLANNIDDFTVRAPVLTLTAPNGGEKWTVNSTYNITWTYSDYSGNVKLEYSTDAGTSWSTVVASTSNTGSYAWKIPNTPSNTCRVRISSAASGIPSDISDADFEIQPESEAITLVSPNGGETWIVNTQRQITWSATSVITNVRLWYSMNGGANWTEITTAPNTGSYTWTVPAQTSTMAKIKVEDALDGLPSDESDGVFNIASLVAITVQNSSGEPGKTGIVNIWLNNQVNVRGILFRLTDIPDSLQAGTPLATPVGRATGFTVSASEKDGYVQVLLVSMAGAVIPVGNGPILQLKYTIKPNTPLGTSSNLVLSNVSISDANNQQVVPDLNNGIFSYVKVGDLNGNGAVTKADLAIMADIVLGKTAPTPAQMLSGDVDHDGDIDLFDMLAVFDLFP